MSVGHIAGQALVSIRYFSPAPHLRGLVSSYYRLVVDAPVVRDLIRAELGQVRFVTSAPGRYIFADGRSTITPRAMLTGPTASPIGFEAFGELIVFGAGLMPAGWAALIGEHADRLADAVIDLSDVAGPLAAATLDRIGNAQTDVARVAAADAFFDGLALRSRVAAHWFTTLADDWLTRTADPQVDALIAASGMSVRQIERMMRRVYGGSPKLMARKYRALQATVRLSMGQGSWSEAAGAAFYDQSHFIREFKQFVGLTPTQFISDIAPTNRLTIAGRSKLAGLPKLALIS
jgi:AraC-like DNA-binding protein